MAAVIDLFSRRVVGWSMSATMTAQLVADALMMAIWRRGKPDALLHHSDQGSQYSSEQFQTLLAERRSPVQTRPRLLTGYPAPPAVACSHAAAAPTRPVQRQTSPTQPPPVGPLACLPRQPKQRSTAPSAQTPAQDPPVIDQRGPNRPSGGGTQANTVGVFSA